MDFPSHVQLPDAAREELVDLLNEHLACSFDLYSQLKQAHWNVRGERFLSLHELFDTLGKKVLAHSDELAERLGALGGYAEGTARLAAKNSQLPEYDLEAVEGDDHLSALLSAYAIYSAGFRDAIARCAELDDPATEDLFTQLLREVEKDLWFLESHLVRGGRPTRSRKGASSSSQRSGDGDRRSGSPARNGGADEEERRPARRSAADDANREGGEETSSYTEKRFEQEDDEEDGSATPWRDVKPPPH